MRREALFMILGEKPKAEIVAEGGESQSYKTESGNKIIEIDSQ